MRHDTQTATSSDPALAPFRELILSRTGLLVRENDDARTRQVLLERTAELSLPDLGAYAELLRSRTLASREEWRELVALFTTGESFFFRDAGQMALLRNRLLPELIENASEKRVLRVWSAGCSGGEEPYSLAILLWELLPDRRRWDLRIIGSDLNEKALERAREGRYREWSLRRVSPSVREQYFTRCDGAWQLNDDIRSMVTFRVANLLDDSPLALGEMAHSHLILCRNVFIYFDQPVIARVLRKFETLLDENGYLLTGHGELHSQDLQGFQVRAFEESMAYQRVSQRRHATPRTVAEAPQRPPAGGVTPTRHGAPPTGRGPAAVSPAAPARELRDLLAVGDSGRVVARAERLLDDDPNNVEVLCLAAEAHGNMGRFDQAEALCKRAAEVDTMAPLPHYLLAQLAQERGDSEAAKRLLKRVLYLDPESVPAYVELGDLYAREGNASRARGMRDAARELLAALPSDAPMDPYVGPSASELSEYLTNLLDTAPAAT